MVWRARVPDSRQNIPPVIAAGYIVLQDKRFSGLIGVDTSSGRLDWRRQNSTAGINNITGLGSESDRVIVGTDGMPPAFTLDPRTGNPVSADMPLAHAGVNSRLIGDLRIATDPERMVVTAYSVRTGDVAWQVPRYRRCQISSSSIDESGIAVLNTCGSSRSRLEVRDPASGRLRWSDDLDAGPTTDEPTAEVRMRAGIIVVSTPNLMRAYRRDGRVLLERHDPRVCISECTSMLSAGILAVATWSRGQQLLTGVDVRNGRTLWSMSWNDPFLGGEMFDADGLLFTLSGDLRSDHMAAVLTKIDPSSGHSMRIALPFADDTISWIGYQDHTFFVLTDDGAHQENGTSGGEIWAFRLAPEEKESMLGDLSPSDWPDACKIVSVNSLKRILHAHYEAVTRESAWAGVNFDKPISCGYVTDRDDAPQVRITVAWVCRTAADAASLLNTYGATPAEKEAISGLGDEAYSLRTDLSAYGRPLAKIILRVGRTILTVSAIQDPRSTRLVAERAAADLASAH